MASNPYINKVLLDSTVLIDLTSDTVTASAMAYGVTAHAASGEIITGILEPGDVHAYGNSSYLVGTARIGTGYVWTTFSGEACIVGKSEVDEACAV